MVQAGQGLPTVSLLGSGTMGAPMALNIARAGIRVMVWNRTAAKAEPLRGEGVEVATEAAQAVAGADVLVTMLADAGAIADVLGGPGGALASLPDGAVWAQMSTVGVDGAQRLERLAAEHGVTLVDAPVLGSREPAESGELVVFASGPDDALARCAPVFDAVGTRAFRLGAAGAGSRLKVVVNAWLMSTTAALAETIALAGALDVDPERFLEVTDDGAIGALYTKLNGTAMAQRSFETSFPLALALKDASLALEAAGDEAQRLRVLEATREQFARAADLGHGDSDWAAVIHAALPD